MASSSSCRLARARWMLCASLERPVSMVPLLMGVFPPGDPTLFKTMPGPDGGGLVQAAAGWSGGQFPGDLRHVGALETRDLEFVLRGQSMTVAARQCSRAVRRPAGDFAHVH